LVQYLACLAVVQAVKSLPGMEEVNVGIKWPNDIYIDGKVKIGGILCQSVVFGSDYKVTIGVGINVDNKFPTVCLNQFGSQRVEREQLLAELLIHFEKLHTDFEASGFSGKIQDEYEEAWLHSGQSVKLESDKDRLVVIQGISSTSGGCLLAKDPQTSELYEL
jgi:biotin--protein ligase